MGRDDAKGFATLCLGCACDDPHKPHITRTIDEAVTCICQTSAQGVGLGGVFWICACARPTINAYGYVLHFNTFLL
jgi:hypothetical protein